jgi:hypothetical protein
MGCEGYLFFAAVLGLLHDRAILSGLPQAHRALEGKVFSFLKRAFFGLSFFWPFMRLGFDSLFFS